MIKLIDGLLILTSLWKISMNSYWLLHDYITIGSALNYHKKLNLSDANTAIFRIFVKVVNSYFIYFKPFAQYHALWF